MIAIYLIQIICHSHTTFKRTLYPPLSTLYHLKWHHPDPFITIILFDLMSIIFVSREIHSNTYNAFSYFLIADYSNHFTILISEQSSGRQIYVCRLSCLWHCSLYSGSSAESYK